jgi:hypothetical protein
MRCTSTRHHTGGRDAVHIHTTSHTLTRCGAHPRNTTQADEMQCTSTRHHMLTSWSAHPHGMTQADEMQCTSTRHHARAEDAGERTRLSEFACRTGKRLDMRCAYAICKSIEKRNCAKRELPKHLLRQNPRNHQCNRCFL